MNEVVEGILTVICFGVVFGVFAYLTVACYERFVKRLGETPEELE